MKRITSLLVFLLLVGLGALQAQVTITGAVTSVEDGNPMPGVSVIVPGTKTGTSTNVDGLYKITVPEGTTQLQYSFIGMIDQILDIDGRTVIDVEMQSDAMALDEVVVTAFGITRDKKAVAYQTQEVSGDELLAGQTSSAAEGLVGKVAGLQINVQNNDVKGSSQIILRGLRSISSNNEALIIIDGSIASSGAFRDLNPNDIESVNVLKGATAAALYGANASNGALIVETKKGAKNKRFTVGYTNTTTYQEVAYMPDFQTEHGTGWDGDYNNIENTNWGPRFDGQLRQIGPTMPEGYVLETQMVPYAPIENNIKDFFQKGKNILNTVYLSGGDETSTFYMSVGNNTEEGIVPDNTYKKYNFTANGSKVLGKITLGVNATYMKDDKSVVGDDIGDQDRAFYWFLLNTPANIPLTSYSDWDNPASYGYADNYQNAFYQNPYWAIGTNRDNDKTQRLRGNISAKWDILNNLNFTSKIGINSISGIGKYYRAAQDYDPDLQPYHSPVSSFVTDSEFQSTSVAASFILNGTFDLTDDIGLRAILGSSSSMYNYRDSEITGRNLSIPGFFDISNATGQLEGAVDETERTSAGVFADIELNFKEFVYLNVTGRQDYTSTLSEDARSYFYPGAGISLILSEAIPSIKSSPVVSLLKITANNSTVYRDLGAYQINERYYQSSRFPFGSINGFYLGGQAVDPNIQKEKVQSNEFGLNSAFYRGRITFDAAYALTKTTDLITSITTSDAAGATSYLTNLGELSGHSLELSLGGKIIDMRDLSWDINVNYTSYDQVVEEGEATLDVYTAGYGTYAIEGESFPQIKAVAYVRDDQDRIVVDATSGNPVVGDLEVMGKTTPDYILGLTSALKFKGLSLSTAMDFRTGHVYYAQGQDAMEFTGRSLESVSADRQDFVFPNSVYQTGSDVDGNPIYTENTNLPISGGIMDFWQNQYNNIKENYVKDATAFKVRELALNYDVPKKLLSNTKVVTKLTVGLVARNILTVLPEGQTKFSDPEFRNIRDTDDANGIGIGGYLAPPPTKSYGFSVKIEF